MGSKIPFYILLTYVITVADLCRSKTPLFIYDYIKIHYFNLIQVREGPQGKDLSLCTYYGMYVARKLKFIPSNSLEINNAYFHNTLYIKINVLGNFRDKKCQKCKTIKYPSLNHGALHSCALILFDLKQIFVTVQSHDR